MAKKKSLPKVKKNVSAFLSNEDGKILKRSVITIGSVVGSMALVKLISDIIPTVEATSHSDHTSHSQVNDVNIRYRPDLCAIEAEHTLHTLSTGHWNSK